MPVAAVAAAAADGKAKSMGNGAGPDVRLSPHTSLESTPFPQTPRGFTRSGVVGGSGNSAGGLTPAAPLMDPNRAFQVHPAVHGRGAAMAPPCGAPSKLLWFP